MSPASSAPEQLQCYSHSLKIPSVPVFKLNKLVEPTARRTANDAGLDTAIHRDAVSAQREGVPKWAGYGTRIDPQAKQSRILPGKRLRESRAVCEVPVQNFFELWMGNTERPAA